MKLLIISLLFFSSHLNADSAVIDHLRSGLTTITKKEVGKNTVKALLLLKQANDL